MTSSTGALRRELDGPASAGEHGSAHRWSRALDQTAGPAPPAFAASAACPLEPLSLLVALPWAAQLATVSRSVAFNALNYMEFR